MLFKLKDVFTPINVIYIELNSRFANLISVVMHSNMEENLIHAVDWYRNAILMQKCMEIECKPRQHSQR